MRRERSPQADVLNHSGYIQMLERRVRDAERMLHKAPDNVSPESLEWLHQTLNHAQERLTDAQERFKGYQSIIFEAGQAQRRRDRWKAATNASG